MSAYQELFNYMKNEHNVILMQSEMQEIERIVLKQHSANTPVSGSLPSRKDFLKTMLDWHDEYLKAGRFNIPLDHEQSEYLSWLAYRLEKVYGNDR